jgi:nitric oxide reductase subunit C
MVKAQKYLLLASTIVSLLAACAPISSGQALFLQNCAACHATTGETVIVGPPLASIATRAETRVASMDARSYITQSIIAPSDYLNPAFKDVMPKSFGTYFKDEDLQDLVDYLMALK